MRRVSLLATGGSGGSSGEHAPGSGAAAAAGSSALVLVELRDSGSKAGGSAGASSHGKGSGEQHNVAWALLDVSKQSVNTRDNVQLEMFEYPVNLRKGTTPAAAPNSSSSSSPGGDHSLHPANVFLSVELTLTRLEDTHEEKDGGGGSGGGGFLEVGSEDSSRLDDGDAPLSADAAPEVGSIAGLPPPPSRKVLSRSASGKAPPTLPPRTSSGVK